MSDLSKFATKIVAENDFIKASLGGFAGSGKTRTGTEFIIGAYKLMKCTAPVLIIDNEKGSRFLKPIFDKAGIPVYIKESVELSDVLEAFSLIESKQVSFLFIDSLTKVWYKYTNDYKAKNRKVFMTLQDWGKVIPAWQESFANPFVELKGNCLFTGRGGYTYDMEENQETKRKEFVKSGVKMKMAGETPFEPDLNIWMELQQDIGADGVIKVWREALIMKDRSGIIDGKTFKNPTFADFEPVVKFLLSVEKGEVAKTTNPTNLAPHEEYDDRRAKREIYLDKIKSEFEKRQFSTSKEDKQIKVFILEKCFGTNSWVEVEKFTLDNILVGYNKLISLFPAYDQANDKLKAIEEYKFDLFTAT